MKKALTQFKKLLQYRAWVQYILGLTILLINCVGLYAAQLHNIFPYHSKMGKNRYVQGDYYSYSGQEKMEHLIYPIPENDGLGIHSTIDLSGKIKFGPSHYTVSSINYSIDITRKQDFLNTIKLYWPSINPDFLQPSYSGIRPKLIGSGDDFKIVKTEVNSNFFLSILGYESPGLTASLGLAKYIKTLLK